MIVTMRSLPPTTPAVHRWPTNNALLRDVVFPLLAVNGLWTDDDQVLDVTYHDGVWWRGWRPSNLAWYTRRTDPGFDFRAIPLPDRAVPVVAFDPPYSPVGGKETTTIVGMHGRYGNLDATPDRPEGLIAMNAAGLVECCRVARTAVVCKTMDFVTSRQLWRQTAALENAAAEVGWVVFEELIHTAGGRPQPTRGPRDADGNAVERRVLRPRPRPSVMLVFVPHHLRRGR
jgi:hypothetical protein